MGTVAFAELLDEKYPTTGGNVTVTGDEATYNSLTEAAASTALGKDGVKEYTITGSVEYVTGTDLANGASKVVIKNGGNGEMTLTTNYHKGITANDADLAIVGITINDRSDISNAESALTAWEWAYITFDGATHIELTDVTFTEGVQLWGDESATISNCTFDVDISAIYSLWVGTSGKVIVEDCKFTGTRGIKTKGDYDTSNIKVDIDVNGCTFDGLTEKPALVHSNDKGGTIALENNTYTNMRTGIYASEAPGTISGTDTALVKASVTEGGETTYFLTKEDAQNAANGDSSIVTEYVAEVDGSLYTSLAEAVTMVQDGDTLTIFEGTYNSALEITKRDVTVIGEGEVLFTATPKFKGENYSVKGIDFLYEDSYNNLGGSGVITDCNFSAAKNTFRYCYANGGRIEFNRCNVVAGDGYWAIHFDGTSGADLIFKDSSFTGKVALAGDLNSLVANGTDFNNSYVNIWGTVEGATFNDCQFNNIPYIFTGYDSDNVVEFTNCTTDDESSIVDIIWNGIENTDTTIIIDGKCETKTVKIGDAYYKTFEEALVAATGSDVIDLLGNVHKLDNTNKIVSGIELTIENGTFDISNTTWGGNSIFDVRNAANLTMNDVNFIGTRYSSAYGVIYAYDGSTVTLNNCDFDLNAEDFAAGGVLKGNGVANSTFIVNNCNFELINPVSVIKNTTLQMSGTNIDAETLEGGIINNAFREISGTITDSKIYVIGFENGIKNDSVGGPLTINGDSVVKLINSHIGELDANGNLVKAGYDLVMTDGSVLTIEDTAKVYADVVAENSTVNDVTGKGFISMANTVYVQYKKTDIDTEGKDNLEGSDTYEIVLAGANAEKINELASADLTFDFVGTPFDNANMSYSVTPAKGVTLTQIGDRYMFNYNGVDKYEETGAAIVIGTITVDGYGRYTLGTKNVATNAVYATEIRDSIVDGFETAADLVINFDMLENDGMVGNIVETEIKVPVRDLTIDIEFNNAVNDNAAVYQDMTVTVSGGDLTADKVIKLGTAPVLENTKAAVTYANGYEIVLADELTLNTTYVVTVTGAGYRTARATVTMTEDKAVTFWNNVKDVEGANYLAGDIVKDNTINLYDLSAVVSYFGTNNTVTAKSDYAKYDLNRDGKIDSKDVAYVLVSWGK